MCVIPVLELRVTGLFTGLLCLSVCLSTLSNYLPTYQPTYPSPDQPSPDRLTTSSSGGIRTTYLTSSWPLWLLPVWKTPRNILTNMGLKPSRCYISINQCTGSDLWPPSVNLSPNGICSSREECRKESGYGSLPCSVCVLIHTRYIHAVYLGSLDHFQ